MHHPGQLAYGLAEYVGLQRTQRGEDSGGSVSGAARRPPRIESVGRPASAAAGFDGDRRRLQTARVRDRESLNPHRQI